MSARARVVPGSVRMLVAAVVTGAMVTLPSTLRAQEPLPDFLFKVPTGTLGFRVGFASPRGQSDIWNLSREQLTLGSSAGSGMHWGAQLGLRLTERLDLAVDLASSRGETASEFRDWVDTDDRPIEQTTFLSRVPLTVSLKAYLTERGESLSRFVWIPAKWTPYVGAGGGVMWYVFEQSGDWVDFESLDIFTDTFRSDGKAGTFHVMGGLDVALGPRFVLNTEGRYLWASGALDARDFEEFDDIDLSGFQVTAGIAVRF